MADDNNPASPGQGGTNPPTPPANNQGGDKNNGNPPAPNGGAPKISDDDVVNHPIYKGVYNDMKEMRDKLKNFEAAQEEANKKKLEENGQFKELAEKAKADADSWKTRFEQSSRRSAFTQAAVKAGLTHIDDAFKLIDQGKLTVKDDGIVDGADALIDELKKEKPYLFGKAPASVGAPSSPANPGGDGGKRVYKRSELRDMKFFEANKTDILSAAKEGRIEDDLK